jgi:hypothetical protein
MWKLTLGYSNMYHHTLPRFQHLKIPLGRAGSSLNPIYILWVVLQGSILGYPGQRMEKKKKGEKKAVNTKFQKTRNFFWF